MNLDVRTGYMATAAACFIVAIAISIFHAGSFRRNGTLLWVIGWVFQSAFWSLLSLLGIIWDFASIVLAHTFLAASFSLLYAAVREFQGLAYRRTILLLPPVVTFAFFWYFSAFVDNISYRITFISSLSILQISAILEALFHKTHIQKRRSYEVTCFAFLVMAVVYFLRLLEVFILPYKRLSISEATTFQYGSVLIVLAVVILSSIGFALMIQERTEETFRESEEKFRQLAENIGEVFYIADPGLKEMIYVSPAYEKIWGRTTKGLYENPKAWMEAIHPADREKVMAVLPERIRKEFTVEYRIVHRDASIRWIWDRGFPMRDVSGKVWRVAGIAEDITQRKQIEEALRTSEDEAKRLARENAVLAEIGRIISSSPNINEVYKPFSEKVRELIPFDRITIGLNNLEGNVHTIFYVEGVVVSRRQTGDIVPHAGTTVDQALKTRKGILVQMDNEEKVTAKFPGLLPDFRSGLQSGLTVPLITGDQTIGALSLQSINSGAYTDRDLKLAESIANQIAGAIANNQLFAQRQRLEERLHRSEKMEALGALAGKVAHDLNNILSGIVGYPGLILMQLPEDSPLRESILAIKKSGQKAATVVQDLLTLARRGVISMEVMNWNRVISDYLKSPEQEKIQSLHPHVRFEVFLESDLLPIKGSRVHLSTTLMNLLSNAAESIPESGVVTISTRNHHLDRPVAGYDNAKEGDYVVLEVSDTGSGISAEDIGRIFEPFYTKKVAGRSGTGLGLAVVWGTVKDHNGYIHVHSEEGKGTTFTLHFPVTREALTLDPPSVSLSDFIGKGETILVVDDVKEQRELVVAMLNKLNYRVTSVSSGEAAIEDAKVRQPDLLVLDMIMDPGIDGLETYRRILELHPGQKAVIVSGFSETERVGQALDLGAGAFVKKPYTLEKIAQVVRRELDRRSLSNRNK